MIQGKFKSYHNTSDNVAKLHTSTFYALLDLAELNFKKTAKPVEKTKEEKEDSSQPKETSKVPSSLPISNVGLHYNIQIHLPATKDVEVYNAIFKSLKEHLID